MLKNPREIYLHQMCLGFLPIGMVEFQKSYYQQIGSSKSTKNWGLDIVQKMLRANDGLRMERKNLLNLRAANAVRGLNNISLQTAVSQQHNIGREDLEEEEFYLLENRKDELMEEHMEMIRAWRCEIMIARGNLDSSSLESIRYRGR